MPSWMWYFSSWPAATREVLQSQQLWEEPFLLVWTWTAHPSSLHQQRVHVMWLLTGTFALCFSDCFNSLVALFTCIVVKLAFRLTCPQAKSKSLKSCFYSPTFVAHKICSPHSAFWILSTPWTSAVWLKAVVLSRHAGTELHRMGTTHKKSLIWEEMTTVLFILSESWMEGGATHNSLCGPSFSASAEWRWCWMSERLAGLNQVTACWGGVGCVGREAWWPRLLIAAIRQLCTLTLLVTETLMSRNQPVSRLKLQLLSQMSDVPSAAPLMSCAAVLSNQPTLMTWMLLAAPQLSPRNSLSLSLSISLSVSLLPFYPHSLLVNFCSRWNCWNLIYFHMHSFECNRLSW